LDIRHYFPHSQRLGLSFDIASAIFLRSGIDLPHFTSRTATSDFTRIWDHFTLEHHHQLGGLGTHLRVDGLVCGPHPEASPMSPNSISEFWVFDY